MKRYKMRWLATIVWFIACGMVWAAPVAGPLRALMEKSALGEGWTRSDKAEYFDENTLFDLVDGEAEAYFPYGFKGAVSADYTKGEDKAKQADVELYEMGSLLDAYGIYSSMRDTESKQVDVGAEGFGGSAQIMFYSGKYFVKARVYPVLANDELLGFAKAVADVLPADKRKPAQLSLVAIPNLIPRSDQYIGQSVLGYAYWPRGMIAQVKSKDALARVFVVMTDSPPHAAAALDNYIQEVVGRGTKIKYIDDEGKKVITLNDRMQEGVSISQVGKYLIGAANLLDPEKQGLPLLKQLRRQVPPCTKKDAQRKTRQMKHENNITENAKW